MFRPKNEIEDLLLSIAKNCETLIHQTHTKPEETLKFKLIEPRETFHFNPPILIEGSWMIGLTILEEYNSIFNVTEENNKFELYKFPNSKIGGISYEKVWDENEKDLGIRDFTATDLQDYIIGPIIIQEYRKQIRKRIKIDKYLSDLAVYNRSIFQDFVSFLRTAVDLVEDDIRLVLDEYNSNFITSELEPGIYTVKDLPEALLKILQPEYERYDDAIDIVFDDVTMKTELVARPGIIAIRFDG